MADVKRDAITAYALGRLADPKFRQHLQAVTANGERPIIAVLRSDRLSDVWDQVHALGDAGNILIPAGSGYLIIAMTLDKVSAVGAHYQPALSDDCTMGLFLARLLDDGGVGRDAMYRLADGGFEKAHADLVGVAE